MAAGKDSEASAPKGGAGTKGTAAKGEQPRKPAGRRGGAAAAASKESGVMKKRIVAKGERPRKPAGRRGGAAAAASKESGVMKKRIVAKGERPRKPAGRKSNRALTAKDVRSMGAITAKGRVYVGIDLHRDTLQIAVADGEGTLLREARIVNTFEAIEAFFTRLPRARAKCVVESSSVWYAVYRFIEGMGFDMILSNPLQTALIARSKNKNDKVDAKRLAELLRLNSIPSCYVPDDETVKAREAVNHRARMSRARAKYKVIIQSILLQKSVKIKGARWSPLFIAGLYGLGDWRIKQCLEMIARLDEQVMKTDLMIKNMVAASPAAQLLTSMPGFGNFTALALASWIGPIERFNSPYALAAYFGMVPSERSSAEIKRHGRITKTGSPLVRWVLSEAVLSHVTHVDTDIARYYENLCKRMPAKKAMIAAAHKMLRIVYWMLKKNLTFVNCMAEGSAQFKGCRPKSAALAAGGEGA